MIFKLYHSTVFCFVKENLTVQIVLKLQKKTSFNIEVTFNACHFTITFLDTITGSSNFASNGHEGIQKKSLF